MLKGDPIKSRQVIDIHTHGMEGYDTRSGDESSLLHMARIYASSGVTEVYPTIYPDTIKNMRERIMVVRNAMAIQKRGGERPSAAVPGALPDASSGALHRFSTGSGETSLDETPIEAVIGGVHLEGPFLNPERCGALDKTSFIPPSEYNFRSLVDGFEDMVKIITIAPELPGAVELIRTVADMGIVVSMGHSDATYTQTEAGFNAGARGITHLFNAMRGFHHREPGIAGFGLLHDEIFVEVIGDPYHLDKKTLELIFRIKRKDRIILVSDSVKETTGQRKEGIVSREGRLKGGAMSLGESSKYLVDIGFDRDTVLNAISSNPAEYLGGRKICVKNF